MSIAPFEQSLFLDITAWGQVRPLAIPQRRSLTIQWIMVSTALIALALLGRVGMIAWPFLNDSGLYAQLGRTVANGDVLYRDFYETKLPGSALLASAFWRAFGSNWAGYVLCQLAMTFIAAGALARSAPGNKRSELATFLFAVVFLNLSQAVYTGFQLETLQAFFEALAAMAAVQSIRRDDVHATFTAGLAGGMAAMAKPGGLGVAVALGLVLLLRRRRRKIHLIALSLGVFVPTAATAYYTIRTGAAQYLPQVLRDIHHYASGTPVHADAIFKLLIVTIILAFPYAMRPRARLRPTPMLLFAISWFTIDLLAVLMQQRLYPYHFLPLACPAAMLYGMIPGRVKPISIAIGLLPIALLSLRWEGSDLSNLARTPAHLPISDYIAAHTGAGDSVFCDQNGRLLIETNRQPGSRLGTLFYMVNDDQAPARYTQMLLGDFESRRPKYLVLSSDWENAVPALADCEILTHCPRRRENLIAQWAKLRSYVRLHYQLETNIGQLRVYRRCSSSGTSLTPGR